MARVIGTSDDQTRRHLRWGGSWVSYCPKFNLQFHLFFREKLYFEAGMKMDDFKAIDDQF